MNGAWPRLGLFAGLIAMGAGWGLTQPMTKIAVSEGYRGFGIIFWQFVIGALLLGTINAVRGKGLPMGRPQLRLYLVIALIGTLLPNAASYHAAITLPAGVLAIIISMVPMLAFPIALAMGQDRFGPVRLIGLLLGLAGVLLIALPGTSLPDRAMVAVLPIALIAPLFYALESNVVAKWGTSGLDAIQVLLGGSLLGLILAVPAALWAGQWITPALPLGRPDLAIILSSAIHALAYASYVSMVGRAGPVFTVQVSYLVTGFGILWSMLLLGEGYSGWIWAALVVMLTGMFLVQPRSVRAAAAAALVPSGNDASI